jgi:hypothetical protein
MCDVTKAAVSTWENSVAIPEIKKLLIIRSRISFSFDWLITGEGQMKGIDTAADIPERRLRSRRNPLQHDRRRMDRRGSCGHDRHKDISTSNDAQD